MKRSSFIVWFAFLAIAIPLLLSAQQSFAQVPAGEGGGCSGSTTGGGSTGGGSGPVIPSHIQEGGGGSGSGSGSGSTTGGGSTGSGTGSGSGSGSGPVIPSHVQEGGGGSGSGSGTSYAGGGGSGSGSGSGSGPVIPSHAQIPSWIKNTAKWWFGGQTSDKEFAGAIGYLVGQKIINAKSIGTQSSTVTVPDNIQIPSWIKNNANWWAKGCIKDSEFLQGITYMLNSNIITFTKSDNLQTETNPSKYNVVLRILDPTTSLPVDGIVTISGTSKYSQTTDRDGIVHFSLSAGDYVVTIDSQNYQRLHVNLPVTGNIQQTFNPVPLSTSKVGRGELAPGGGSGSGSTTGGGSTGSGGGSGPVIPSHVQEGGGGSGSGSGSTTGGGSTGSGTGGGSGPVIPSQTQNIGQLSIPQQVIQEATSSSGAIVNYVVSAYYTHDGKVTPTCDYNPGNQFPLGNTVVTCTATDSTGHNPIQKSFTVIVRDTTPPEISPFQPVTGALDDTGGIVYFTISATDLVDGPITPHCNSASGDKFPIGVSTITCTAEDSRGNHAARSLQITITKS